MTEQKQHKKFRGSSRNGRTTVQIECPFCGTTVTAYVWSLAGCGKKCECGAKHSSYGLSSKDIVKQKK